MAGMDMSGNGAMPEHGVHPDGHASFAGPAIDHAANGFDPHTILRDFDWGKTTRLPSGRVLREWELVAKEKEIELAPGVRFAAWTYNGRVPGPTLRCREGDRLRITFANASSHPHTIHFHGIHPAAMDGVPGLGAGQIEPGGRTVYEFDAQPAGLHLYHCHVRPLAEHIAKGLYGAFIVDPKDGPRRRRRDGDGHERVRHELRPRQRDLRRQHDRLRVHGQADRGRAQRARAPLRGERPRVRPHQLVPPPRQPLQLLPDGDLAGAVGVHGHRDVLPGAARDPRDGASRTPGSSCSTPTSRSSPSWAGRASSRSRADGGARRRRARRPPATPSLGPRRRPAGPDRGRGRRLRRARRTGPRRPQRRRRSRSSRSSARAAAGGDPANRAQRRPGRRARSRRCRSTTRSRRSPAPRPIGHLRSATLKIRQPWIEGESYEVVLMTSTGGTISTRSTPPPRRRTPTSASSR